MGFLDACFPRRKAVIRLRAKSPRSTSTRLSRTSTRRGDNSLVCTRHATRFVVPIAAVLVEGNFDVVSLHARGIDNVVAPLGTAFTQEQAAL